MKRIEVARLFAPFPPPAVGEAAIVVSVAEQRLYLFSGECLERTFPISTSRFGVGGEADSFKTPLGLHRIVRKIGAGVPWGTIFRGRRNTKTYWRPGDDTEEDLILSRILRLSGLEPGRNRGAGCDSYDRFIYIHGTNQEARIGTPASIGCIRMRNDDVIDLFERVHGGPRRGTLVQIIEPSLEEAHASRLP